MKIALAFVLVISGFVPCLLPAQRASRSENPVGTIYQDKSGYHWCVEGKKKLLRFSNYSTKHGLANNLVNDLIRDSSGFLWIYSPGGISRFDGVEFKNYAFPYHGYDGNYFALDKQANLWATDGIDLFTFNRKLDKFEQVALAGASREGMSFIQSYSQGTEIWFREGVDLYKIETKHQLRNGRYLCMV